jgi:hypothetical protein
VCSWGSVVYVRIMTQLSGLCWLTEWVWGRACYSLQQSSTLSHGRCTHRGVCFISGISWLDGGCCVCATVQNMAQLSGLCLLANRVWGRARCRLQQSSMLGCGRRTHRVFALKVASLSWMVVVPQSPRRNMAQLWRLCLLTNRVWGHARCSRQEIDLYAFSWPLHTDISGFDSSS